VLFQIRGNAETFNPLVTSLLEIWGCPDSCLIPPAIQQRQSFFCQFSHVDTECYQRFLDEFSAYPNSLNILQVDNGQFHKGKALVVPENVILLFQPPYCPELNPIERLWEHLKADLKWASCQTRSNCKPKWVNC
jgi:hypothetical protein